MKRVVLSALAVTLLACGGSTQHTPVQEVPIDQGGGHSSDPSDDFDAGGTATVSYPDGSAPPGVGPQSLDAPQDAGASTSTATTAYVQRPGGLTQKECTDVIMKLATLMTRENHIPPPTAADLGQHPIFGQMLTECSKSSTKKQHKCAMASTTMAAWKKCME